MAKIQGPTTAYMNKLKDSEYWQRVRHQVKMRDHFACKICGDQKNIDVHHIRYNTMTPSGKMTSIIGKELDYLHWTVALCRKCHKEVHADINHKFNHQNPNSKPYNHI